MKFCTECGEKLVPGKKFCPSCGTQINVNIIKQEPPKTEPEIQVIPISKGEFQDISEVSDVQVTDETFTDKVIEVKPETSGITEEVVEAVDIISDATALIDGDMSANQTEKADAEVSSAKIVEESNVAVEENANGEVVFDNTDQEGVDENDGDPKSDEIK